MCFSESLLGCLVPFQVSADVCPKNFEGFSYCNWLVFNEDRFIDCFGLKSVAFFHSGPGHFPLSTSRGRF